MENAQNLDLAVDRVVKGTSLFSRLPKPLRVILIVLSIITIVWWVCWLFYHFWNFVGKALHWISDRRNWWIYTSVILILCVGGLLLAQFYSDIKPFTHLFNYVKQLISEVRNYVADLIA